MIYHTRVEYTNHYITDTVVIVSVLDSCVIDHGLQKNCIGGVMVSVLDWSVIDRGLQTSCIGGVMVSVLDWSVIDHGTHDLSHSSRVH
jgi:hypothetical protein